MSKILWIQFSNSAAYPPIQNAVNLCLREGHEVNILCIEPEGAASLRFPENIEKITRRLSSSGGRLGLMLLFIKFCSLVFWNTLINPGQWLYASEPMAAPVAYYAKKILRCRVIYHEHDAPPAATNRFQRFINHARLKLASTADAIVVPNADRLRLYLAEAECADRKLAFTVWNCPLAEEILSESEQNAQLFQQNLKLYFHGSIGPSLLPFSLLEALTMLPDRVSLSIAGYSTDGGIYLQHLLDEAQRLGVSSRVFYLGFFNRETLLPLCAQHDVGICFYDQNPALINHHFMAGASNKPFDYLSQGLTLLISDNPEQRALFSVLETSAFCDSQSAKSIADAVNQVLEADLLRRKSSVQGPLMIKQHWNYAAQFKPVLELLGR